MSPTPRDVLGSPRVRALVRRKARSLEGTAGITHQDLEDVEQDLLVALWPRLDRHDATRSPLGAFVCLLLNREGDRLVRRRLAGKRRGGRAAALDLVDPERDARTGREGGRADRDPDLALDLADAVAGLPAELRDLVEVLPAAETVAGAARALGRKRTTVHDQLARVRVRLSNAGLLPHVQNARHSAGEPGTESDSRPRSGRRTRRKQ